MRKMRHMPAIARVFLGLTFLVLGLNGFFSFLPVPTNAFPKREVDFLGALANTGYMNPLIFTPQVAVGILLLVNRFVPLALALIAPVIVNIVALHIFLAPSGLGLAIVVAALAIYLAWTYRALYRPMLTMRA